MSEWNLQSSLRLFPAILLLAAPWFAGAGSTQKLPITIPIQVADNLVYMQGRINGSQPLSVVLDTGSSVSIVSPAVAQEIGLRSSGSTQAAGIGHGGNQSLQFVENARLQLGSGDSLLDLDGQRIAILPIGYVGAEAGLRVGDVITALDGKRDMPLWRVADDLKKPDSSPMLSIRRGHKDFQATLHLRTLL